VTLVVAHRGAHGVEVENTLAAFAEAHRLGADGVEFDVRRSRDGALVVHHDAVIPGLGPICEADVRDLPAHVPLLGEVLDACAGMFVNVEVKNDPGEPGFEPDQAVAVDTAAAIAAATDPDGWSQVILSSFSPEAVDAARAAEPRLAVGWLLGLAADVDGALSTAADRGYQAVHPFVVSVGPDQVDRARALGLALHVWVVNSEGDLRRMIRLGVDSVITDDVERALTVAIETGSDLH
jgi:glycerophosphoryl diester phosphodiesterase